MINSLYTTVTQRYISIIALFTIVVIIVVIFPFVAIKYSFITFTICLTLSKLLLSFISHVSLLHWGSTLKSIIDSLLLSTKSLLRGSLKPSFNVDAFFNSSNILIMLSFKSLLISLKHGPCRLQLWKTDSLSTLLELLLLI